MTSIRRILLSNNRSLKTDRMLSHRFKTSFRLLSRSRVERNLLILQLILMFRELMNLFLMALRNS